MDIMFLEFVNSQWYKTHELYTEPLENDAWVHGFCEKWDLLVPEHSQQTAAELLAFRSALYQVVVNLSLNHTIPQKDIEIINTYLKLGKSEEVLYFQDSAFHKKVVSRSSAANWMIYRVTSSLVELITNYPLDYLRKCANPECDWFFYDVSKNHTRKWCENRCASRIKVRRHRAAKKEGKDSIG